MNRKVIVISLFIFLGFQGLCYSESELVSVKVNIAPVIDGEGQDQIWTHAQEMVTHDKVANLDITIKSVYTKEKIFFLIRFPDLDESRIHKPWIWNQQEEIYELGPEREDCLIFKWAMDPEISDLSLQADKPYTADVWFWKANRTDPTGYADDKIHRVSTTKMSKSMELRSKSGTPMFLRRKGDKGTSAYKSKLYVDFSGAKIPQYEHQNPTESRADVKAKGIWSNNEWCIEFSRSLKTDQADDVQFDLSQRYFLGVSSNSRAPDLDCL